MESEDVRSLRDQVQRLNAVLAKYHEKYPPIHLTSESADLPWLTDKSLMSPLLAEYDANLQSLRSQVEEYQSSHRELRSQVDKLIAENKRLTRDLKAAVEREMAGANVDGDNTPAAGALDEDQLTANLQSQLQMALQEKDSAMEMWQAAVQEVDRLEQQVQSQHFNPRLQTLEAHTNKIRSQYEKTVGELQQEVNTLTEELKKSRNEHKAASIQVLDLRRTLEEMKHQMMRKEQEKGFAQSMGEDANTKADELAHSINNLEGRLQENETHLTRVKKDRSDLESKIIDLQKKNAELEQREYEAVLQVKESVQMVESAMLEKDEALVREKQASEDVSRLQDAIAKLLDEAGARTRAEVDTVKKQCNENMSRLMEEIHALELENSEKQAQNDRAIREKRAVESELEKIYQEGLTEGKKESGELDELNRRACNAERLRDEAVLKMDSATANLRRLEMKYNTESRSHKAELESVRELLDKLGVEFEIANSDRLRLMEEVDELKKKRQNITQERDAAQRNYTKEVALLERNQKQKTAEYEVRLQAAEDGHRHAMLELRQLLSSQQRMSAKWKEECQTITAKFESIVSNLRNELSRYKKRNEDLTKLLKESRNKTIEAEHMMSEYTRNIRRMEERVREAENRAANTTFQVSQHLSRSRPGLEIQNLSGLDGSLKATTGDLAEPMTLQDLIVTNDKPSVHFSTELRTDR